LFKEADGCDGASLGVGLARMKVANRPVMLGTADVPNFNVAIATTATARQPAITILFFVSIDQAY
jgi:hypothetical protein